MILSLKVGSNPRLTLRAHQMISVRNAIVNHIVPSSNQNL